LRPQTGGRMSLTSVATRWLCRDLRKFSNRHRGETCYILGDGPSIKWFDLQSFTDHPAICCGMIPFHRDFPRLPVKYVSFVAPWIFLPKWLQPKLYHQFRSIAQEYRRLIRARRDLEFFVNLSNSPVLSGPNVNYVYRGFPEDRNETDAQLRRMRLFDGSFHATLALAYYMGFSKVYLLGFDAWTIQPARTLHWYELGEGELFEPTNFATDFLGLVGRDMAIHTISADGFSSNVAHVSYRSFTGKEPHFRENYELIDPPNLRLLATCPEFKIFAKTAVQS
jgi:hypothetical protein